MSMLKTELQEKLEQLDGDLSDKVCESCTSF